MKPRLESFNERLERTVLSPLSKSSRTYYAFVLFLMAVVAWGFYAFLTQLRFGLLMTGIRAAVFWGLYLVNFVFFIGISHAGTLISDILRVSKAGWRNPVTRIAELITVVALMIGALMTLIELGRPDRVHHMFIFGRWPSRIVCVVLAITA